MDIRHAAAFAAAIGVAPAYAQETYAIDSEHTVPAFEIVHMGIATQRGHFSKTTGTIVVDRAAKSGSIEALIDTSTVSSGSARRDAMLRSEDYFDSAKHPTATFKATKLVFDGDNVVGAEGELTMRGVTKPVSLKVANLKCLPAQGNRKPVCAGDVSTTVKLTDYGMRKPPSLSDDVRILFSIEAVGSGA
jgi:polyisoprenoid-binding protein YceI